MIRQWSHGHSIGVGMLVALLLEGHLLAFLAASFALGLLVGRFWATLAALGRRFLGYSLTSRSRTPW